MQVKLFTVYDSKAEAYFPPWIAPTIKAALRAFSDQVNKSGTPVNSHPEDYALFCIGEFDDNSGIVKSISPHMPLGKAIELVDRESILPTQLVKSA